MSLLKRTPKETTERFNIRLDQDTAAFLRKKAGESRRTLSEYLRQTLIQGVISSNVEEMELRLQQTVDSIHAHLASQNGLPEEVILSIFTCEALLTAIVEARDIQELYTAQNKAKTRLNKLKASL